MATRILPAKPIFRARLSSRPSNGHVVFIPQIRKLVFEYCNTWPSSANCRTYLSKYLIPLARLNPHVEVVVKQRNQREPIIRGFYLNGSEKVVPLNGFEVTGMEQKVQLLLDSAGSLVKPFNRRPVQSTTEAARGVWSGLHDKPFRI